MKGVGGGGGGVVETETDLAAHYVAVQHAQDQIEPEDMQRLQHQQEPIEHPIHAECFQQPQAVIHRRLEYPEERGEMPAAAAG